MLCVAPVHFRGVLGSDMSVSLDWLGFTFVEGCVQDCMRLLSPFVGGWQECRGQWGYRCGWRCSGFKILYDGQPGMGVHLQISGSGCEALGLSEEWTSWGAFVLSCMRSGGRCTRIDFAFDDRTGITSMDAVRACHASGSITSRWHDVMWNRAQNNDGPTVDSMYFGSLKSDSCLCVYDKKLEQAAHGAEVDGLWIRFELRFKREAAQVACQWVVDNPELVGAAGLLGSAIAFRDETGDSNVARRSVAAWYASFLGDANKVRISVAKVVRPIADRAAQWVRQQAASFVFFMLAVDAVQGRGTFAKEVIEQGWMKCSSERLSEVGRVLNTSDYHAAIRAWRKDKVE